ncbi:PREDICTED: postacrosomal sheath WW domain-binding protein [Condylura cristata]|uniref:postacrosomal sheath WW domain-binding protein n=1 Tax=Condylura cristata TaxID=143302 RepID=UPI00033452FF|nr:PREDICTED: postacrosomal sheath WW domain-binding protein [Condylura cristata]
MAVNQSHTENRRGVVIPYGESVLKHCEDVELSFLQRPDGSQLFKGTKRGMLFLTSYRVIFINSHAASDPMVSFMMPFDLLSNCSVEQPVFSPNYIQGTIHAAPDGGWEGQATFKLSFRKGGAIEFSQLLMKAASAAARGVPLRSLTVLVAPGSMVCTSQAPCVAYPVFVFGAPPGYGPPHPGYGPPPPGYGPPPPEFVPPPPDFAMDPPLKGVKPLRDMKPCLPETKPHHWEMSLNLLKEEPEIKNLWSLRDAPKWAVLAARKVKRVQGSAVPAAGPVLIVQYAHSPAGRAQGRGARQRGRCQEAGGGFPGVTRSVSVSPAPSVLLAYR